MTKMELFLILFPVDYLKEVLIPETNKLLKHPMYLGEFIRWLGCWFYMGFWVVISNRRNGWSTTEPTMSEGVPIIKKYMLRTRFEVTLSSLRYKDRKDVEYNDGFFHMCQIEEARNMDMAEEFNS